MGLEENGIRVTGLEEKRGEGMGCGYTGICGR